MKHLLRLLSIILFASPAMAAPVQLNVTVPGSGTPFDFFQDSGNNYIFFHGMCGLLCTNQADVNSSHNLLIDAPSGSLLNTGLVAPPNWNVGGTAQPATAIIPGGTRSGTIYAQDVNIAGVGGAKMGVTYNTIAASQTNYVLSSTQGGATGATTDFLNLCVIIPATVNPGAVTIYDNSTALYSFAGGTASVSTLISWAVPFGAASVSGGWKVTTGANVSVYCVGKFT